MWFYVSLAGPQGFVGGCYIEATDELAASARADVLCTEAGIKGGLVDSYLVNLVTTGALDENVPEDDRNRILTRGEIEPGSSVYL